jgi:hypothetical protein
MSRAEVRTIALPLARALGLQGTFEIPEWRIRAQLEVSQAKCGESFDGYDYVDG